MRHTTPWFRFVATTASGAMLLSPTLAAAQTPFNAPQYQTQAPAAPGNWITPWTSFLR